MINPDYSMTSGLTALSGCSNSELFKLYTPSSIVTVTTSSDPGSSPGGGGFNGAYDFFTNEVDSFSLIM